ncbi:tyrosine-type recombinase/integrase [Pirellulaceae bacterium SH501]
MLLQTALDQIAMERELCYKTHNMYARSVRRFSAWLGKQAQSEDLERDNLNRFILHIQQERSNTTAGNYRRALCRLWNHLTEVEHKPSYEIKRLRRPKAEEHPVTAWSLQDFEALLKSAEELSGRFRNIRVKPKDFFTALIWVAYNTGLRPSDLFLLRWSDIDFATKSICLIQNKTKKPHVTFLDDPAILALERIRESDEEFVFPVTWSVVRKWMEKIFRGAAKHGFRRVRGKNLGTLRKTNATQVYISSGESAAAESLGHTSGTRIVRKFYIDHRARRQYSVPRRPDGYRPSEDQGDDRESSRG